MADEKFIKTNARLKMWKQISISANGWQACQEGGKNYDPVIPKDPTVE